MRPTLCVLVLALLGLAVAAPGQGQEPRRPDSGRPKVERTLVHGEWRYPVDNLVRITGRVTVLDAHTLRYEDGTEVDLIGAIDPPDLEQKGRIGDKLYP